MTRIDEPEDVNRFYKSLKESRFSKEKAKMLEEAKELYRHFTRKKEECPYCGRKSKH